MTSAVADTPSVEAHNVVWDLAPLLDSTDPRHAMTLVAQAHTLAESFARHRGTIATRNGEQLGAVMIELQDIYCLLERAGTAVFLAHSANLNDAEAGQRVALVTEKSTAVTTQLVFFDLEWAALDDAQVDTLLSHEDVAFCRHYLKTMRANRPHLLSESEELVVAEKAVTGVTAWTRLFDEQMSDVFVDDGEGNTVSLETALSTLSSTDAELRQRMAQAITAGLAPGLRTRAYIYNTVIADRSIDDRLRKFASWTSNRNLANQASDASVRALVDAVSARNDIPQRWYRLKAKLMGVEQLKFYDRNASLSFGEEQAVSWTDARDVVLDAYSSFSNELGSAARDFFDNPWIHAPALDGKRGGAFCAPTVPHMNPFLLVNFTGRHHDVLTLAHEMGHGIHYYLSGRKQSVFEFQVPLTVAETASVFGETLTFNKLLETTTDPRERLALLASNVDGQIATVFRQVAMYQFEALCHEQRRRDGELSVEHINANWMKTQNELFAGTVDATGYESWWSYVGHFIHVPGYVYAYAFGNLLALSVFERAQAVGPSFVPSYIDLLSAGGSRSPEGLGQMVGCDLTDPNFWTAGLDLVDRTLRQAEEAAALVGNL
jgi:oligoendopeptidase F